MLAVGALNLFLHLGLNLVFQLQHLDLFGQRQAYLLQASSGVKNFQYFLPLGQGEGEGGGYKVAQPAGVVDVEGEGVGVVG